MQPATIATTLAFNADPSTEVEILAADVYGQQKPYSPILRAIVRTIPGANACEAREGIATVYFTDGSWAHYSMDDDSSELFLPIGEAVNPPIGFAFQIWPIPCACGFGLISDAE